MSLRSLGLPASSSTMPSIALCTSAGGGASGMSPWRWRMRVRVLSSLDIGSCTALIPRSPQTMPQRPIAVSKIAKWWPVMLAPNPIAPCRELDPGMKSRLGNCCYPPGFRGILCRPTERTWERRGFPPAPRVVRRGLVNPSPGASLSLKQTTGFALKTRGGTYETDPATNRRFQPRRLVVSTRVVQPGGSEPAGARGGAHLRHRTPGGMAREERRAAHRLCRQSLQRGVRAARRPSAHDRSGGADLWREGLYAPVQDQRQIGLHRRRLAMAPGLRHLEARRRHAAAARDEYRDLSRRGDADQWPLDAGAEEPDRRRPQGGARPSDHLLSAVDAGRGNRDAAGEGRRHRRADRQARRHVTVPRQPGARLGRQHHTLSAQGRVSHAERSLELHPHANPAGIHRTPRLYADPDGR